MILVHIFVAEHKALKNLNIPINGSFNCTYSLGCLKLFKKEETTWFYSDHHCTAVIGPNGAGKSSSLEVLELLSGESDSRALVVFFDRVEARYHLCKINMTIDELGWVESDAEIFHVPDNQLFLFDNNLHVVKINTLSGEYGGLNFSKTKTPKFIHDLSIRENVKSTPRKKRYFEKLLSYFNNASDRDEFMERVSFEFTFSSSSLSIVERVVRRDPATTKHSDELLSKWEHIDYSPVLSELSIGVPSVFQRLLGMNVLSILSALSKVSGAQDDVLSRLLHQYSVVIRDNADSLSVSNCLRRALQQMAYSEWVRFSKNGLRVEHMNKVLEGYLNIFERIATLIIDHCYDGEYLNLRRVKTDDYATIEELTEVIQRLPANIAANIKWGWRGISSGELARAHVFSESYHYLKTASPQANHIFLLDEADLYLHPEWQRTFLHEFLSHLGYLEQSRGVRKPQVIICTHSPIMISDFLPDDIVSLAKNEDGDIEVTPSSGFGNSIADIYMNGMHLTSTFGEHAQRKIARLLQAAKQGQLTSQDRALIEKLPGTPIKNYFLYHDQNQ